MRATPAAGLSATLPLPRRASVAARIVLGLLLAPAAAGAYPLAPMPGAAGAGGTSLLAPVALTPSTGELPRWGAIYATTTAAGFGLTVGLADRQEARRGAESQCRTSGVAGRCRLLAEFAERCAAVAQGVEHRPQTGARTRRGFVVTSVAAGAGRTAEEAETAALDACEKVDQWGFCLVAASACSTLR